MLKILGISANLNDIIDELDTILDDPYDRYLVLNMNLDSIIINYIVYFNSLFNYKSIVIKMKLFAIME